MLRTIITDKWNNYLELFASGQKDIYYSEEYVKLYEDAQGQAFCAVCEEDGKCIIMPFIRKQIENAYDFETAYGYGGPISNADDAAWNESALSAIAECLKNEGYVCGFTRFHTLLNNADMCTRAMQVLEDRKTIAIDTSVSEDEIWSSQIISKNRNMIRKAEKSGLIYKAEYDFASLKEFKELYKATMSRLSADDFYFFDDAYFDSFAEAFKNRGFLGTVRKDGKLICAALFMYSAEYGHYHLEGSDLAYSSFGANNLLLWETAKELHRLGVKWFHLGGGSSAEPDNSLFKFKKAFSHNVCDFKIGKWIFNEEKYRQLKETWIKNNPEKVEKYGKLLLCYRY